MRRIVTAALLLSVLLLGSCDIWYKVVDPGYSAIQGTWTVNLATRPAGWPDTRYVFTDDKELEIYYGTELGYKGDVTSVEEVEISVTTTYKSNVDQPDIMRICHVLSDDGTSMRLGWYDGNDPIYHLDLTLE